MRTMMVAVPFVFSAELVAGLIAVFSSAATIFGLPASPFVAAAAATACVAVIAGGVNLESTCTSASVTLRQGLDDRAAFHNGHWPPTTTN